MSRNYEAFGPAIRQLRIEKKIPQRELAARIGLDFTYISKIESGKQPPPSERAIRDMAKVLDGDADELMRLAGKIPSDLERYVLNDPRRMRHLRHMSHLPDWEPKGCAVCDRFRPIERSA